MIEFSEIIPEAEVSINNICNLRCKGCGFYIPNQPLPSTKSDVVAEHYESLKILEKVNVKIDNLAILGGEPLLTPLILENAVEKFSSLKNINAIEIVTNGLHPQGLTFGTLKKIQKISISVYKQNDEFINAWKIFIKKNAPNIEIAFRIQKKWNEVDGKVILDDDNAQKLFENCWYRKHCVSIERRHLFLCSVAAKLQNDEETLLLDGKTSRKEILNFLNKKEFMSLCKFCVPAAKQKIVDAGIQKCNINLNSMMESATKWLCKN